MDVCSEGCFGFLPRAVRMLAQAVWCNIRKKNKNKKPEMFYVRLRGVSSCELS